MVATTATIIDIITFFIDCTNYIKYKIENGKVKGEKLKQCTKCKIEKPITEFAKRKASKDGLCFKCKQCVKEYQQANKKKIREKQKEYKESNREKIREINNRSTQKCKARIKSYYKENKEKILTKHKEYRETNKEQIKAKKDEWRRGQQEKAKQKTFVEYIDGETKHCKKCDTTKETKFFSRRRRNPDGLMTTCKQCVKEYQQANKEKIAAYNEQWRKDNPERMKQLRRDAYARDPLSQKVRSRIIECRNNGFQ
jgi:hypothetical protein